MKYELRTVDKMKILLIERGMTQAKLAVELGIKRVHLNEIIRLKTPGIKWWPRIAEILQVTIEDVYPEWDPVERRGRGRKNPVPWSGWPTMNMEQEPHEL